MVKTSFVGYLPRDNCSTLDHTTITLFPMILLISLKSTWQNKVSLKVAFFAWSVALGKILNMDNLRKWHVIVVDWCCMCKKNEESVDHLLLHCKIVSALWNTIFSSVELAWIVPSRVVDLFAC
jgi:hypothetical protein